MGVARRKGRLLVALCLVVFQVQLVAAATLGCRHFPEPASSTEACPYHRTAGDRTANPESERLLDCQKCALHCAIGVQGLVPAGLELADAPLPAPPEAQAQPSFASLAPDLFLKPPISTLL